MREKLNQFIELPRPVTEATEFRVTTKRGEEAPRLATRIERYSELKSTQSGAF